MSIGLAVAVLASLMPSLMTVEVSACWVERSVDPVFGYVESVTVCRIDGEIVEYGSEVEVPSRLYPEVGVDGSGTQCWYWTSRVTPWVLIVRNPDGTAVLGWDPDGVPGGPVAVDVFAPVCTSEPVPATPDSVHAYRVVRDYVHTPPVPAVDPPPPRGLAGLDTRVAVTVPTPFAATLVSPGSGLTLDVEASVAAVRIAWGDGERSTYPRILFDRLTGGPDGAAHHVYQVKTCTPPGADRCHPDLDEYPLIVAFEWAVRWRAAGGGWQPILVAPSSVTVPYPVGEIVSSRVAP